jgi:hypothetical protein
MLTFYDFDSMDEKGKGDVVFQAGTFIDNRIDGKFKVQLYRVHSFYVEVFYDAQANEIIRYRSFKSFAQLAPYVRLEQ